MPTSSLQMPKDSDKNKVKPNLKTALRENLKKRKAQARSLSTDDGSNGNSPRLRGRGFNKKPISE